MTSSPFVQTFSKIEIIAFMMVVLPVPGPPVIIENLLSSDFLTASS